MDSVRTSEKRIRELKVISCELRMKAMDMIVNAAEGHPAPAFSISDFLAALFFEKMNLDPQNPKWEDRDRFVLSKGHACATYYAALAKRGFFPEEELLTYRMFNSNLPGHPDSSRLAGVEVVSGSLGNGVSSALGLAWIAKRTGKKYKVFVIAGDGEIQEGIVWEAVLAASMQKLDNFILIVDYNKIQSGGFVADIMDIEPLEDKFRAFNWDVYRVDGHNMRAICDVLDAVRIDGGKPKVIIADTIKGKGVSYMENQYMWHMRTPTPQEYEQGMAELREEAAKYAD